jgi:predicted Rossmann fold flavoprotein
MKIAVIGGGASGLFAALSAAWQGANVTLFERNQALGRKILVTGSGRCNLTNDNISTRVYTCDDPGWIEIFVKSFGVKDLITILETLGIPTYKTWDGWYYPLSNSAHSVVSALSHALQASGTRIRLGCQVLHIARDESDYQLVFFDGSQQHNSRFDRIVVASGGKAYPTLGSKGELFPVVKKLGHTILPIKPALAPVLADLKSLKSLKGVRLDLGTNLLNGNKTLASATGNMIFTEWGLNGPAVMDISHHIPDPVRDQIYLSLNLLAYVESAFNQLLSQKRQTDFPLSLLLGAFFPPKVVRTYSQMVGISEQTPLKSLDQPDLARLTQALKDTRLKVLGVRGFQYAQASIGGVPVSEVDPTRLESKIHRGLFMTGETLNIVGPCGGYNLHFAFSSGILAGRGAAQIPNM